MIGAEGQRTGPGTIGVVAIATAVLMFLIAPVVIIVIVSFSAADYLSFPPPGLSLRWYERFFGTPDWRRSIVVSVQVASLTMVFATVLGRATLPLIAPGVVSAALFAFLTSFDELLIPLFLAGVEVQTLTVRVWNSLLLEVDPTIAAVSSFLIAVTCAVLGASALLRRRTDV